MDSKPFTLLKREPAFNARVQDILVNNRAFLRESHACFPAGLSRDYFVWGLDPNNHFHKLFLEVSSMYNSSVLFAYNAESIIDSAHWPAYLRAASHWAGSGTIEAYTDNMAFHYLNNKQNNQELYSQQYNIMSQFFAATIEKMKGSTIPTTELMAPARQHFANFPFYQLHINPNRSKRLGEQFLDDSGNESSLASLNEDGWSVCVANIELVKKALNLLDGHFMTSYLQERYRLRYEGQNALLNRTITTRESLLQARAPEIMVSYTLAYFFASTSHAFKLHDQLEDAFADQLVQAVAEKADILVRIINDLGALASASPKTIEAIFDSLLTYHYDHPSTTSSAKLFEEWSNDTEILPFFTIRLKKDLTMGEDNVARDYLVTHDSYSMYERLAYMQESVIYFSKIYQETKQQFEIDLTRLTESLNSPIYSQLAKRFVNFHEQIYGNNYQGLNGEYAV